MNQTGSEKNNKHDEETKAIRRKIENFLRTKADSGTIWALAKLLGIINNYLYSAKANR